MSCKRVVIDFRVTRDAQKKLDELLKNTTHKDPILGVFWHSSQVEGKPKRWKWDVMTHERSVLDSYDVLEFEVGNRTFYSVHEDPEAAAKALDGMMIVVVSNKLAVLKQRFWRR